LSDTPVHNSIGPKVASSTGSPTPALSLGCPEIAKHESATRPGHQRPLSDVPMMLMDKTSGLEQKDQRVAGVDVVI